MSPTNHNESLVLNNPRKEEEKKSSYHKLSRKERRAFQRKLKKPKYQKIAKRIIQSKMKK